MFEIKKDTVQYITVEDNVAFFFDKNPNPNASVVIQPVTGNRLIDYSKVAKIRKAMENGEDMPPIIINAITQALIDGQHRAAAALQLWKSGVDYPIQVVIIEIENESSFTKHLNCKQKTWKNYDYLSYNVALEIPGYKELEAFIDWTKSDRYDTCFELFGINAEKCKNEVAIIGNPTDRAKEIYNFIRELCPTVEYEAFFYLKFAVKHLNAIYDRIPNRRKFIKLCHNTRIPEKYNTSTPWKKYFAEILKQSW